MNQNPDISECVHPAELVRRAKDVCEITTPNEQMSDLEIRNVLLCVGQSSPDANWLDPDNPKVGSYGLGVMLFLGLAVFPEFMTRLGLIRWN